MADKPRRRRMSRSISLVLLTSLPGLAGCGEKTVEVDEVTEQPPPSGPEHVIGAPFVAWWASTHPPIVVRKTVPRSVASRGGYYRGRNRVVFIPIGGRSGYVGGGQASPGPGHSAPVSRGGFGSSGRGAVGG